MASTASKFVTREEFETVKSELTEVRIRLEVLNTDAHRLTHHVADLREDMTNRFDGVDGRLDALERHFEIVDGRFGGLEKTIQDGHAAVVSLLHQLIAKK